MAVVCGGDLVAAGVIPFWLSEDDPRPAREQLNEHYAHGGGWNPMEGWELIEGRILRYPEDPDFAPLAVMVMRDEVIMVYEYSWVVIKQADGSFEVARMD